MLEMYLEIAWIFNPNNNKSITELEFILFPGQPVSFINYLLLLLFLEARITALVKGIGLSRPGC